MLGRSTGDDGVAAICQAADRKIVALHSVAAGSVVAALIAVVAWRDNKSDEES